MPVESVLNVDELLQPIPGDNPAGTSTPFAIRSQLDEARKEVDPSSFAADDPLRPDEFKKADWGTIEKVAKDALKKSSKDLLLAARLTEALCRLYGFVGLRDSLKLLRSLVTDCWDRLVPEIDDPSDIDIRAAPFEWLDDADHGARFPGTIRSLPLIGDFSWLDWKRAQDSKDRAKYEAFEKAVVMATAASVHDVLDTLDESAGELNQLSSVLADKLKDYAPSFTGIRMAIDDARTLMTQIAQKKGSPETAQLSNDSSEAPSAGNGAGQGTGPIDPGKSRAAIYQSIAEAAARLEKLEPHSPVPYLLRRCVDLGMRPFPEMIKAFVRDDGILQEIDRELGIPPKTEKEEN